MRTDKSVASEQLCTPIVRIQFSWASVQPPLPLARHAISRAERRLVERVVGWGSQLRAFEVLVALVVVEPVLARLEAMDDGVLLRRRMLARVLRGGLVAAADVTALPAAAQVEPPASARGDCSYRAIIGTAPSTQ
jgi:hypothetical protein